MANLYYNGAVDTNWDTVGNWWLDSGYSSAAGRTPANGDTVYIDAEMDSGPNGAAVTLVDIICGTISSSGFSVTLNGAYYAEGPAEFHSSSNNSGTVSGDATFNDSSNNSGTVSGDATFNDYSNNYYGTVSGDATFNDSSYNYYGTVSGDATFCLTSISTQVNAYGGSIESIKLPSGLNGSSILGLI
jgi:flagellar hook-associated protein FlgK